MDSETMSEEELFLSDEDQQEELSEPVVEAPPIEPVETPATPAADQAAEPQEQPPIAAETVETPPEPTQQEAAAEQNQASEHSVPSWRLREVNEAKTAAETQLQSAQQQTAQMQQQMAQMQTQLNSHQQPQPTPPPNQFEDPDGFERHQAEQAQRQNQNIQEQFILQQREISKLGAMTTHGADVVTKAMDAAIAAEATNPGVATRIAQSQNPWLEAVTWHREIETQKAIGEGGIDGFRDRTRTELMKDPEFRQQVLASLQAEAGVVPTPPTVATIPSLNGMPAASVTPAETTSMTEEELFLNS